MKAPSFKPIYEVIRIKKKDNVDINTDLYKEFLNVRKIDNINLKNKDVKIIIYEHTEYDEKEKISDEDSNENSYSSDYEKKQKLFDLEEKKKVDKKVIKSNENTRKKKGKDKDICISKNELSNNTILSDNKKDDNSKNKMQESKQINNKLENIENNNENLKKTKNKYNDVVKEKKKINKLGTVKILYNFYVNLFDKLKEDVENIKNNTFNNNIDLFKDMNLYTNYISLFDIINLCEDLKIIKNFLNSKKECELIWILTVNYFDKVKENIFEKYKYKIDVCYKKDNLVLVRDAESNTNTFVKTVEKDDIKKDIEDENLKMKDEEKKNKRTKGENIERNKNIKIKHNKEICKENEEYKDYKSIKRYEDDENTKENESDKKREEKEEENNNNKIDNNNNKIDNNYDINKFTKDKKKEKVNYNSNIEENNNIKDYIYEKCSQRENDIMFRKVNFFTFVYIIIYIIKVSTRKIKSINDDIKKVRSFFFFLNLYEKKKTIETLTNIYKDKYLNYYQNFNGIKEIEEHRKRKIFCHKFSFYNINKILNKREDLILLKNKFNQNDNSYISIKDESKNVNENDTLNLDNTLNEKTNKFENSEENKKEDLCNYELTNYMETSELKTDSNLTNKTDDQDKKENILLNQHIFDYIFKNYCYKKNYWKLKEGNYIDFGQIKDKNKKFKIDIYNYSKYNLNVDIEIENELPLLAIFKDKLFCVNSKYTIYLHIDKTQVGEKLGFINVKFKYKNINKEETIIKIPVYIYIEK
ncbi:conserved Plasmodium protein, unknown function [Plasmodium gallinaceum]|uniref:Uncharacterized protein n=1 Tax=Plasmodium gallinaceum TaxID=5849 RepID=A0A1J1GQ95_PLAGA|nr:conserved Plasmodium protein, unknown function [Plasmodium gallinaceum]CRG93210.1 conserved Plasmodium protein, unknown function [Plasmodium gallinaceum]